MLEVLFADPCRVLQIALDPRNARRLWRQWRGRGARALINELSADTTEGTSPLGSHLSVANRPTHRDGGVLVIDASVPRYDQDAGSRSSYLYLRLLAEMGYSVRFMPNDQVRREPYSTALEHLGIQVLHGRGLRCGGWQTWLRRHQAEIETVILHRPNVAPRYPNALKRFPGLKILYFAQDLRCLRETRHFQLTGDRFHRREADYWEGIERRIVEQADRSYFFSHAETEQVASWRNGDRACAVPLFPLEQCAHREHAFDQRSGLLFVGGFAHAPNRDAVLWFAREVFPLVRAQIPDIEWHVVGPNPPDTILKLDGNGVRVEGAVSEQRLAELYECTRMVVALRFGAGIKGKIIEAMHHGIPIATTDIGAEGIPDGDKVLCISDDAVTMARQIIDAHEEREIWTRLHRGILDAANTHLSIEAARQQLRRDLKPSTR